MKFCWVAFALSLYLEMRIASMLAQWDEISSENAFPMLSPQLPDLPKSSEIPAGLKFL